MLEISLQSLKDQKEFLRDFLMYLFGSKAKVHQKSRLNVKFKDAGTQGGVKAAINLAACFLGQKLSLVAGAIPQSTATRINVGTRLPY